MLVVEQMQLVHRQKRKKDGYKEYKTRWQKQVSIGSKAGKTCYANDQKGDPYNLENSVIVLKGKNNVAQIRST